MNTSKTHTGTQVLQAIADTLSLKPKPLKYLCGIIGLIGGTVSMYLTAVLMNKLNGSENFELLNEFVIMGVLFDLFKNLLPVIAYRLWIGNQKFLAALTSVFFTGLVLLSIFASITALDTGVNNVLKSEKPVNPNVHLIDALESNLKDLELLRDRQVASNQTSKLEGTTKRLSDLKVQIANLKSESSSIQNIATPSSPIEMYGQHFIYLASVLIEVLCLFATVSALVITDVGSVISSGTRNDSNKDRDEDNQKDKSPLITNSEDKQTIKLSEKEVEQNTKSEELNNSDEIDEIVQTQDKSDSNSVVNIFPINESNKSEDDCEVKSVSLESKEPLDIGDEKPKLAISENHQQHFETMSKLHKVRLRDPDMEQSITDVVTAILNEEVKLTFRGIDEMFKLSRQGKKELFDLLERLDYVERNGANGTLTLKHSLAA